MVGKGVRDILASLVLEASLLDIEKEDSQDLICRIGRIHGSSPEVTMQ